MAVLGGAATFAAAFSIVFLSSEFFIPMRTLGSFFHTAMDGMAAGGEDVRDSRRALARRRRAAVDPRSAHVACRGVGYSYDGQRQVLEGVNFDVPCGSFIGVTGESGSGKSTLAGILSGTNARYAGEVASATSICAISRPNRCARLSRRCRFRATCSRERFARTCCLPSPTRATRSLWEALAKCRLAGFVRESGGLDMEIAAEGANLSGGQRQRLAFARALLHDSPIYIFDEATSNIDAESEAAIISAARELAGRHTVIMISHRLSAIEQADAIYVLEQGKLAEHGTHFQLLAREGAYARLWESQSQLEAFAQSDGDAASSAVTPGAVSGVDALEMPGEAGEPVCARGCRPTRGKGRRSGRVAAPISPSWRGLWGLRARFFP